MIARVVARLLAIALCCLAGTAGAQATKEAEPVPSTRAAAEMRGPMLGILLGVANASVAGAGRNEVSGPLFGARAGWGVSPRLSIRMNADLSAVEVDSVGAHGIMHVDLVARHVFVRPRREWAPYLEAGATHRYVRVSSYRDPRTGTPGQLDATGVGLVVGIGGHWWDGKRPLTGTDVGIQIAIGGLTSKRFEWVADDGVETRAVSVRLAVGSSWFPLARRYRR